MWLKEPESVHGLLKSYNRLLRPKAAVVRYTRILNGFQNIEISCTKFKFLLYCTSVPKKAESEILISTNGLYNLILYRNENFRFGVFSWTIRPIWPRLWQNNKRGIIHLATREFWCQMVVVCHSGLRPQIPITTL